MAGPKLFEPLSIDGLELANRIVIAPMCMYSAEDGQATDWHLIHYGQLALSGAGLLIVEATGVAPEGRISWADLGLWDDATEAAMGRVLDGVRAWSDMPIGIQLAHAGRKASTAKPWEGEGQYAPHHPHGWQTVSASDLPFRDADVAPEALDAAGLERVAQAFADSATRAARLGFDLVQVHMAHGYLLHQFLSPLSNCRTDEYGGSLENRMRFPLEVFRRIRAAFPAERPVTVRVSVTDWVDGGWNPEDCVTFVKALEKLGCAAVDASSGGLDPRQKIPVGPNYQVPLARALKEGLSMPVAAVGLITEAEQAEAVIGTGEADMIQLARGILYDPRWPWHAAASLGARVKAAPQYLRSQPRRYRDLFDLDK